MIAFSSQISPLEVFTNIKPFLVLFNNFSLIRLRFFEFECICIATELHVENNSFISTFLYFAGIKTLSSLSQTLIFTSKPSKISSKMAHYS